MDKIALQEIERRYKNNGQHAEQVVRFTLTGIICKADNTPFDKATDCLQYQIKYGRATVCKGTDIKSYLQNDKASEYIYVSPDFKTAWIMNKTEWLDFCERFSEVTYESKKNGGGLKRKIKYASQKLLDYLG